MKKTELLQNKLAVAVDNMLRYESIDPTIYRHNLDIARKLATQLQKLGK